VQFSQKVKKASMPLAYWYREASAAVWSNFADVKQTFGQTDQAKVKSGNTVLIFDIGGNKWRLIAGVSYPKGKLYILRIMTHKEYDLDKWKGEL
jgi:mRNA interferase HigB